MSSLSCVALVPSLPTSHTEADSSQDRALSRLGAEFDDAAREEHNHYKLFEMSLDNATLDRCREILKYNPESQADNEIVKLLGEDEELIFDNVIVPRTGWREGSSFNPADIDRVRALVLPSGCDAVDNRIKEIIAADNDWQGCFAAVDGEAHDKRSDILSRRSANLADQIVDIPATTIRGLAIKARVACWCRAGETEPDGKTTDERIYMSLVRDLLAMENIRSASTAA